MGSRIELYNFMNSDIEEVAISHSLEADMATGWKPKLKIIGPMPLNYDNPVVDKSIMALVHQESAFYEVVYMGTSLITEVRAQQALSNCTSNSQSSIGTNTATSFTMTSRI